MKAKANVNSYILFLKEGELLLGLRQNTGWEDGTWATVAGGQEYGESVVETAVREAEEEAGVIVRKEDLKVVHVMHHNTGFEKREKIDVLMECRNWEGEFKNMEPHKCAELKFFPIGDLPENIAPYLRRAILKALDGEFYSEYGFKKEESLAT